MGTYLNPGRAAYEEAVNSEIFVDKSEMIQYLNTVVKTKQKYVSVSRPRRFGKTMAADMICAYYGREADSRELFAGCKLAQCAASGASGRTLAWDAYLGQFDVIRLVMTRFFKKGVTVSQALDKLRQLVLREIKRAYPDMEYFDDSDFVQTMEDVYASSDVQLVVVIDEWDAVFRENKDDTKGQTRYLDFLRDWLKDKSYVALAYITGILPIKKYGKHSALNMFTEYSMMFPRQLAKYTGFTEAEVEQLCRRFGRDYDRTKDWYDGYEVNGILPPNPGHAEQRANGKAPEAVRYALYSPLSVF